MLLRGILFLIISKDFLFSAIISKIQASKLPTVPESQAPMHNGHAVWKKAKFNSRV
jgi:hypothetical protein